MRNFLLLCVFLVGLLAIPPAKAGGNSSPPTSTPLSDQTAKMGTSTRFDSAQRAPLSDQAPIQAPVIFAVDDVTPAVPPLDNSPNIDLLTAIAGILLTIYELVVRYIPTTKSISALAFIYKILNLLVPDRSKNGSTFNIRDKL